MRNVAREQREQAADEPPPPPISEKKAYVLAEREAEKKRRALAAARPQRGRMPSRYAPTMMRSDQTFSLVCFVPGRERATGSRIIDLDAIHQLLKLAVCPCCRCIGKLIIDAALEREERRGLASKLTLICTRCKAVGGAICTSKQLPSSSKHGAGLMETNVRAAVGATQIGIGEAGLGRLAACLNMPKMGHDAFTRAEGVNRRAAVAVGKRSMEAALALERQLAYEADPELVADNGCVGVQLLMDGQWMKPGKAYNSKEGTTTAVGGRTKQVVAAAHRTKDCSWCKRLPGGGPCGRADCNKTHVGSSASMEAAGAVEIIESLEESWVYCAELCTDCDSSLQKEVCEAVEAAGAVEKPTTRWDPNHVIKASKGKLLPAAKKAANKRGALTHDAGLRLMKETAYALHQHRGCGDARKLANALDNVLDHAFNRHERCCQFFDCPVALGKRTKSFYNKAGDWLDKLGGRVLEEALRREWRARLTSEVRVQRLLSTLTTNHVEAVHSMRAAMQRKANHFAAASGGKARYYATVARHNDGAEAAVAATLAECGVAEAGDHLRRGLAAFDAERARHGKRARLPSAKRQRREAKQRGRDRDAAQRKGGQQAYGPGMAFGGDDEAPRRAGRRACADPQMLLSARGKLAAVGGDAARATAGQGSARFLTSAELRALLADAGAAVGGDRDALVARFCEMRTAAGFDDAGPDSDAPLSRAADWSASIGAGYKRTPPSGYENAENEYLNNRGRRGRMQDDHERVDDQPLPRHPLDRLGNGHGSRFVVDEHQRFDEEEYDDDDEQHLMPPLGRRRFINARRPVGNRIILSASDNGSQSPRLSQHARSARSSSQSSQSSRHSSLPNFLQRRALSSQQGSRSSHHSSQPSRARSSSLGSRHGSSCLSAALPALRPKQVAEPIVVSRLARGLYLPNLASSAKDGQSKRSTTLRVLQTTRDVRPAKEFFEAEFNCAPPTELADEKIGYLDVTYKDSLMAEQRRFADGPCLFGLPKPQRACASADLYIDGDLTASELVALEHVCMENNLYYPKLRTHLRRREQDLASLGALAQGYTPGQQRSFSKAYISSLTHLAAVQPAMVAAPTSTSPTRTEPNATGKLFDAHSVDWSEPLPPWLVELAAELRQLAGQIVQLPAHRQIMRDLRRHHPEKADSVSSALHFTLAVYEYRFLDACLVKALQLDILPLSDQLDGFCFLKHTFPTDMSVADAFQEMTEFARDRTGMIKGEIRMKQIELPDLTPSLSRSFLDLRQRETYVDLGIAGLDVILMRMDRHFTFLVCRGGKPVVVERLFYEGTDIVDQVIERKVADFKDCYATCKITDGKKKLKITELWLERPDRPTKLNIVFEPDPAKRGADFEMLDIFTGLKMDASERIDHAVAASHYGVVAILEHFKSILADDDDALYSWLVHWHAYAVQKRTKPGAIPVLIGESGSGKSILYSQLSRALGHGQCVDPIFKQIFGQAYMNTMGLNQMTARFNMNSSGKLFVVCEEISSSGGTANKDALKGLAEQQTMDCESKFLDTVPMSDHRCIVMLSNHRRALVDTNRKFMVTEVSNKFSRDNRSRSNAVDTAAAAYFSALGEALADPETVHHLFWYLMTLDLSSWSCEPVPNTRLMQQLALEANAIPSWFKAYSCNELSFSYMRGRHQTSRDLLACFMSWSSLKELVIVWTEREFYIKLSEFACSNHNLLKASTHGINGKGYIMMA